MYSIRTLDFTVVGTMFREKTGHCSRFVPSLHFKSKILTKEIILLLAQ